MLFIFCECFLDSITNVLSSFPEPLSVIDLTNNVININHYQGSGNKLLCLSYVILKRLFISLCVCVYCCFMDNAKLQTLRPLESELKIYLKKCIPNKLIFEIIFTALVNFLEVCNKHLQHF